MTSVKNNSNLRAVRSGVARDSQGTTRPLLEEETND